jgi:alkanesulfonate monooxygenase SsuD/methylene tetrahydromethanopterin reductase-like flavin-dependent oxidoreductase (luciferase family)
MQSVEVIGSPDQVRAGLDELVTRFGVDELMITTRAHGAKARLRSFELIANAYGMEGAH